MQHLTVSWFALYTTPIKKNRVVPWTGWRKSSLTVMSKFDGCHAVISGCMRRSVFPRCSPPPPVPRPAFRVTLFMFSSTALLRSCFLHSLKGESASTRRHLTDCYGYDHCDGLRCRHNIRMPFTNSEIGLMDHIPCVPLSLPMHPWWIGRSLVTGGYKVRVSGVRILLL